VLFAHILIRTERGGRERRNEGRRKGRKPESQERKEGRLVIRKLTIMLTQKWGELKSDRFDLKFSIVNQYDRRTCTSNAKPEKMKTSSRIIC